ncbi:unnamed protein product, partial [Prorocentrum cordatum]
AAPGGLPAGGAPLGRRARRCGPRGAPPSCARRRGGMPRRRPALAGPARAQQRGLGGREDCRGVGQPVRGAAVPGRRGGAPGALRGCQGEAPGHRRLAPAGPGCRRHPRGGGSGRPGGGAGEVRLVRSADLLLPGPGEGRRAPRRAGRQPHHRPRPRRPRRGRGSGRLGHGLGAPSDGPHAGGEGPPDIWRPAAFEAQPPADGEMPLGKSMPKDPQLWAAALMRRARARDAGSPISGGPSYQLKSDMT